MERNLSEKLSCVLTPDVIELLGDEACMMVDSMQEENCPEERILNFIEKKLSEQSGKLEIDSCRQGVLDQLRKTTKYQADFILLKRSLKKNLPVRIARNRCFEAIGLHGYALMSDEEVARQLLKDKDIRMISKALAVRDFIQAEYRVLLPIL